MCCVCVLSLTRKSPSMVCVGQSGERVAAAGLAGILDSISEPDVRTRRVTSVRY